VEALHLGHAAKSFALRDKPTALRGGQDIIGQIFNGVFAGSNSASTSATAVDKESKKRSRDEKFSLSSNKNTGNGNNKKLKTGEPSNLSPGRAISVSSALKKGKDRQKLRKMGQGDREPGEKKTAGGQKAPLLVGKNFRKTNGYFRKKLRAQANAEFSVG
jgi:hypothetical protein